MNDPASSFDLLDQATAQLLSSFATALVSQERLVWVASEGQLPGRSSANLSVSKRPVAATFELPHLAFSSAKLALGDEWKTPNVPGLCSESRINGSVECTKQQEEWDPVHNA
ncbi:hypothetical protein NKI25_26565 [Mesorhizobium sp. M0808]|uniref:hypothetical protein n=1 Tax=unclassified Mesorhizobium TaxID=325217 RepID=UPI003338A1CF